VPFTSDAYEHDALMFLPPIGSGSAFKRGTYGTVTNGVADHLVLNQGGSVHFSPGDHLVPTGQPLGNGATGACRSAPNTLIRQRRLVLPGARHRRFSSRTRAHLPIEEAWVFDGLGGMTPA
jgi:hypothetical protein